MGSFKKKTPEKGDRGQRWGGEYNTVHKKQIDSGTGLSKTRVKDDWY